MTLSIDSKQQHFTTEPYILIYHYKVFLYLIEIVYKQLYSDKKLTAKLF